MKDLLTRYANDVIATCAFGVKVNSVEIPNNDFFLTAQSITNVPNTVAGIELLISGNFPKIAGYSIIASSFSFI